MKIRDVCRHLFCFTAAGVFFALLTVIASAEAEEAPAFNSFQRLTNREMAFKLTLTTGLFYRVETAEHLPAWEPFLTFLSTASGFLQHTDTAAPYLDSRYYRALRLDDTNAFIGDHIMTTNGPLTIRQINHATFVMNWNGLTIASDPIGSSSTFKGIPKADLVLVTHDHGDHFSTSGIQAVRNTNSSSLVVTRAVYNLLTAAQKTSAVVLSNGFTTNVLGIEISAIAAYNTTSQNHIKGVGNGYVITLGGQRIYISGDTEDIPEMRGLTNIDVAFVCMNTPFTMNVTKAAAIVKAFHPRIVYPYHFRNGDNSLADLNSFKRQVGTDQEIEVRFRKWY
jgi:L-ascorbate metabolism protein UlaG (beta-lactamase superfamily)